MTFRCGDCRNTYSTFQEFDEHDCAIGNARLEEARRQTARTAAMMNRWGARLAALLAGVNFSVGIYLAFAQHRWGSAALFSVFTAAFIFLSYESLKAAKRHEAEGDGK